jgi:hypothetical protein
VVHRPVRRWFVAALVAATSVGALGAPPTAGADPGGGSLTATASAPVVTSRQDGTKAPLPDGGMATNAVGDVTIESLGCTPSPVAFGGDTTCSFRAQNQTTTATTVDLSATGDAELEVTDADLGATVSSGTASATVDLPPRPGATIRVEPGASPAGFTPLATVGIPASPIADEQMINIDVPKFRWAGQVYGSIGIDSNGYIVPGGGDVAKDHSPAPQDLPSGSRPNGVIAPFWTDLTPAGGGELRAGFVTPAGAPIGNRPVWVVVEWQLYEFGTSTKRSFQVWLQSEDPEVVGAQTTPAEGVWLTYDLGTMAAAPARPFRIGAEDATGTDGAQRPAGALPTEDLVASSGNAPGPAPAVTWDVVGTGRQPGTGTIAATVSSSLIPGSSTVFQDVTVEAEPAPVITDDPDDLTVTSGAIATFTAAATGAGSVQWYRSVDGGAGYDEIVGATGSSYSFAASAGEDGYLYQARFRSPGGSSQTSSAPAELTVDPIATTTSVVPSPAAPAFGDDVTFTATVSPAATGTVQFAVDGTSLGGPVAVSGGSATSPSTSSLAVGDHDVTAVYSGDLEHAGSTGTTVVSVGKSATATDVAVSPAEPEVGDDVTLTATVSPTTSTGTVQFLVDGDPVGAPVDVAAGTAAATVTGGFDEGSHVVEAQYSGTSTKAASTSGPVAFTVDAIPTATAVTIDPVAPTFGQATSFTADISPAPDGGTVQFSVDGTLLGGPVAVVGGSATSPSTSSLSVGDHTVTATYSGDTDHAASTSASTPFTVAKAASTTNLLLLTGTIPADGDDLQVEAQISRPGGTVQFALDGTDVGGPVAVVTQDLAHRAVGTIPAVPAGAHTITATWSGDATHEPSSDDVDVTVYEDDEAFVRRVYAATLGHAPDPSGLAHWLAALDAGTRTTSVARRIATSASGRARLVYEAYRRALDRNPDPSGAAFWQGRVADGLGAEDLLASLLASGEAYQRAGGTTKAFAKALYLTHLGRAPGEAELAAWTRRVNLDNTIAGRRKVALTFARTTEATTVALRTAAIRACIGPVTLPPVNADRLEAAWTATARNPVDLAGQAVALECSTLPVPPVVAP